MKYMGSKRTLLKNGLGHLIDKEATKAKRFVDLFAGSCAVSWFVASRHAVPVWANDLQSFSSVLALAVLGRTVPSVPDEVLKPWFAAANEKQSMDYPRTRKLTTQAVMRAREWCANQALPITCAYGGHYYSPAQATLIDALLLSLPKSPANRSLALGSLLGAAMYAAAAPGHTAQPFNPVGRGLLAIEEAWSRDLRARIFLECKELSALHARHKGFASTEDSNLAARKVEEGDLVFLDPPYSAVHYSRFYHVIETIARRQSVPVTGVGRYPDKTHRPRSQYSMKTSAVDALENLLSTIASRGARAVLTFPTHECSNGLSGDLVTEIADQFFRVVGKEVTSVLSTLGGAINRNKRRPRFAKRDARLMTEELIIVLSPR